MMYKVDALRGNEEQAMELLAGTLLEPELSDQAVFDARQVCVCVCCPRLLLPVSRPEPRCI